MNDFLDAYEMVYAALGREETIGFVTVEQAIAVHNTLVERFRGTFGVRDKAALDAALHRPMQLRHYEPDAPVSALAASICHGIITGHPFVDGNKRTGLRVTQLFLQNNGFRLTAPAPDMYSAIIGVADGSISDQQLSAWFARYIVPLNAPDHEGPSSSPSGGDTPGM